VRVTGDDVLSSIAWLTLCGFLLASCEKDLDVVEVGFICAALLAFLY
jgi:hypothetical protein